MEAGVHTGDSPLLLSTIQGIVTCHPLQPPDPLYNTTFAGVGDKPAEPVKDAKVSARCRGVAAKSTRTDDSGFYELTDLKDGKWRLKVESNSYETIKATVEVSGGGLHTQNFEHAFQDEKPDPDLLGKKEGT